MKTLFLIGGPPGSGKTTAAEMLQNLIGLESVVMVAADDQFDLHTEGKFDPALLGDAHKYCRGVARVAMLEAVPAVIVHNTFTSSTKYGTKPYELLAENLGYNTVCFMTVNLHQSESVHNVPSDTAIRMAKECGQFVTSRGKAPYEDVTEYGE